MSLVRGDLQEGGLVITSNTTSSIRVYDRVGALYDAIIGPASRDARDRAVDGLDLGLNDRLLVVGVGSGLDLPHLPRDVWGLGVDLSEGMLRRARERRDSLWMPNFELREMDAQRLDLPDACFDAVYLPLIVTVASNGPQVLAEAARVAKRGARIVVLDRFWPEERPRSGPLRALGGLLGRVAMHPDRRFSGIHAGAPNLEVLDDEPSGFGGLLRSISLRKPEGGNNATDPDSKIILSAARDPTYG